MSEAGKQVDAAKRSDVALIEDVLNNAHGPLCQFGECPACEALAALARIAEESDVG